MESYENIRDEARRILLHALKHYAVDNEQGDVTAIVCECDPGVSSLYIHIASTEDDIYDDPMSWANSYIEQSCPLFEQAKWFAEFNQLNEEYFSADNDGESDYSLIEDYFANILKGVSLALISIKSDLAQLSFPEKIKLGVMTEDDEDENTMFERVSSFE